MQTVIMRNEGIEIKVEFDIRGCGTVESNLKYEGEVTFDEHGTRNFDINEIEWNAAIDGVEALILAQAISGVDIKAASYQQAVWDALEAIDNNS